MYSYLDPTLTKALMYLEINLISIVLVAFVHFKANGLTKMVAQRNFLMAIDAQLAFFMSDTLFAMMFYELFPKNAVLEFFSKEVYFLSTSLLCFFWFVYFEYLQQSPFVRDRKRIWQSSFLVWAMVILLIVNIFTGICFHVDPDGTYGRGPLFIVLYIISYSYVFFTCIRAFIRLFKKQYYQQRRLLIKLALFPVAPAIAGIIQFFCPELPVACAALAFSTLVIYMDWMDSVIAVDPLTRLNNRKMLDYHYEQWHDDKETNASLYLLMIDANKFKSINDTYGHIQGDKALIRIADAMRLALRGHNRRFNIARFGGDEFAILVWAESEDDIITLEQRIHTTLANLNAREHSPYELTVSIGHEQASHDISLKDLIEKADAKLYEEKARLGNVR